MSQTSRDLVSGMDVPCSMQTTHAPPGPPSCERKFVPSLVRADHRPAEVRGMSDLLELGPFQNSGEAREKPQVRLPQGGPFS